MRLAGFRLAAASTLLVASVASAHDTWLLPKASRVVSPGPITFELTSGMAFPAVEHGPGPDRIARAAFRLGGKTSELAVKRHTEKALTFTASAGAAGTLVAWVTSKPKSIDLTPAQVWEYLEEIGAQETVGREWKAAGSPKWTELYVKHAKAVVRIGDAAEDRSWAEPTGADWEIVPESDPTALPRGRGFTVRVLKAGAPVRDLAVGLTGPADRKGAIAKTDAEGRVSFTPTAAGWWLLRATDIRRAADGTWESHFVTLPVQVR